MSEDRRTPKRLWFRPMPNPDKPLDGGALLFVTNRDGETFSVGLDLARLLQTQIALANAVAVVMANTLTRKSADDITEAEIQQFIKQLDQAAEPTEKESTDE